MARLTVDTRIGDYVIQAFLGQGQFGITYRATRREGFRERSYAIKELFPRDLVFRERDDTVQPSDPDSQDEFAAALLQFRMEAEQVADFQERYAARRHHRHPNVVQVVDFVEAHGTAYMVMDLIDGHTLREVVGSAPRSDQDKKRHFAPMTEDVLRPVLLNLLDGLAALHEDSPPLLHRDIKPGNILIRASDNSPVLIDFGAARQVSAERTRTLTAVLTQGYAPFEQYTHLGGKLPPQAAYTDIYALGAVCHYALTGSAPADSMSRKAGTADLVPLAGRTDLRASRAFLATIDRALMMEPAARFQSARDWTRALMVGSPTSAADDGSEKTLYYAGGQPTVTAPAAVTRPQPPITPVRAQSPGRPAAPPASPPPQPKSNFAIIALIVIALLGAGAISWLFLRPTDDSINVTENETEAVADNMVAANVADPADNIAADPVMVADNAVEAPPVAEVKTESPAQDVAPVRSTPVVTAAPTPESWYVFCIENKSSDELKYAIDYNDDAWQTYTVKPNTKMNHWAKVSTTPRVRYDTVFDDGQTTYEMYDLESIYSTNKYGCGNVRYDFEVNNNRVQLTDPRK